MSIVTLFQYPKRVVSAKPLISYLSEIKKGKYEYSVDRMRDMYLRELDTQFDLERRRLPKFSIAGNFKSDNHHIELITYSKYLFFEIKYLRPHQLQYVSSLLRRNPYVFSSFKNTLGHGLCWILKTDVEVENHAKIYRRAYNYFEKKLKTKRIAKDGLDIQYLCQMSFDPKLHVNIACIPFPLRSQIKY